VGKELASAITAYRNERCAGDCTELPEGSERQVDISRVPRKGGRRVGEGRP